MISIAFFVLVRNVQVSIVLLSKQMQYRMIGYMVWGPVQEEWMLTSSAQPEILPGNLGTVEPTTFSRDSNEYMHGRRFFLVRRSPKSPVDKRREIDLSTPLDHRSVDLVIHDVTSTSTSPS